MNSLFEKIRDLELEDPETGRFFCEMRRSRRCRHLRLSVYPDGRVVLTLPLHESEKKALAFLEEHRKWIQKKRLVFRSRSHAGSAEGENGEFFPGKTSSCLLYPSEMMLPWISGSPLKVEYQWKDCCWTGICVSSDRKTIEVSGNILDYECVKNAFKLFLKRNAEAILGARIQFLAQQLGPEFYFQKLTVRLQKSRWGSCSPARRNISLNGTLIFFPQELMDCVMLHELCHLKVRNHSSRFYQLLESVCPHCHEKNIRLSQ